MSKSSYAGTDGRQALDNPTARRFGMDAESIPDLKLTDSRAGAATQGRSPGAKKGRYGACKHFCAV